VGKIDLMLIAGTLALAACGPGERRFTVLDPDGRAIEGARVLAVRPGQAWHDADAATMGNEVVARVPGDELHEDTRLVVIATGHRTRIVEVPEDDAEIRLARGIPVRLTLADGCEFPPSPLNLVVEFEPLDPPKDLPPTLKGFFADAVLLTENLALPDNYKTTSECWFDPATKTADLLFPLPGRWKVRVRIMRYRLQPSQPGTRITHGAGRALTDDAVPPITIEDGVEYQVIPLAPDPEEFRDAVERVKEM
jgi:hypothetical protein